MDINENVGRINIRERAYLRRHTLTELEVRLDSARFSRTQRLAVVNLERVRELLP